MIFSNQFTKTDVDDSQSLDQAWLYVNGQYELIEKIGEGSYGQVMKAKHAQTGQLHAIKHIKEVFYSSYEAKKVCREIQIMR